tara:strand:- start:11547 stop:12140 length:594 start_codon:yes stop_codon:yes gene_type:complete
MENNTQEAIFNLMQNIVDKSDEILVKIENNKNSKPESDFLTNLPIEFNKLLLQQNNILKQIDGSKLELTNSLKSNKGTNETRNYEYIIFGKDSPLNTRFIIYMIAFVIISWAAIKYVPPFLLNLSELKQEKENYELFYNYYYLKQFEHRKEIPNNVVNLFNKIKNKEPTIMNEYKMLDDSFNKEIRKQELENELKKL